MDLSLHEKTKARRADIPTQTRQQLLRLQELVLMTKRLLVQDPLRAVYVESGLVAGELPVYVKEVTTE